MSSSSSSQSFRCEESHGARFSPSIFESRHIQYVFESQHDKQPVSPSPISVSSASQKRNSPLTREGSHHFIVPSTAVTSPICMRSAIENEDPNHFDANTNTQHSQEAIQFHQMLATNKIIAVLLAELESDPQPFVKYRKRQHDAAANSRSKPLHWGLLFADPRNGQTFFLPFSYAKSNTRKTRREIIDNSDDVSLFQTPSQSMINGQCIPYDCIGLSGKKLPLIFVKWLINKKHLCVTSDAKQLNLFLWQEFGIEPLCQW